MRLVRCSGCRWACRVNGIGSLCVTKLDVLDGLEEIKICTGYRIDGEDMTELPIQTDVLTRCKPIYETCAGWTESTSGIRQIGMLPQAARDYLMRLEMLAAVRWALYLLDQIAKTQSPG
ncbi:MAG: hypothetical protein Ct9H300mP16_11760 [Pseudomonadota bacterium]|nr:MAG: hypothetical protein Ct9H300mP16_11760 [Pseudomonadota bacterium]